MLIDIRANGVVNMKRIYDIEPIVGDSIKIEVDGFVVSAVKGETVLAVLSALGLKEIGRNDFGVTTGAYCGMGICYGCAVRVDGKEKQRACRVTVKEGMVVNTRSSYYGKEGLFNGRTLTKKEMC